MPDIKTTKHGTHRCPTCNAFLDASTGESVPEAGDICICGECTAVLQ